MPKTGAIPRQDQAALALPQMPEMTVAAYKVQLPEGGAWLPGVRARLDSWGGADYKVFVRDPKSFGGVVARVSPDTEEGGAGVRNPQGRKLAVDYHRCQARPETPEDVVGDR
jgi:hypothetical protein